MNKNILIFREITRCTNEQIEYVRILRNSEKVKKFMYTDHNISKEEHFNYIKNLKDNKKKLVFIVFNNMNEIVALVSLDSIDKFHKKADWAFYTNPIIKNIGGIIEFYFIEFFFNQLNFEKLNCEVLENNFSTQKLHKKFLFDQEGTKKENIIKDKKRMNVNLFGLTKNKWQSKKSELSKYKNFFENYNVVFEFNKNFLSQNEK